MKSSNEACVDGTDATLGNLTVFTPGQEENILAMEKFDGLLTSVQCNDQGMSLTFEDDSAFAYAQKVWDWVNGADNHTFIMVAGKGDCGDNTYRIPYKVSKIDYDEERNTAKLTATSGSWKSLIHSYELHVGQVPMSNELGLERRDYTKDASFNLAANFDSKLKVKTGAVFGELVCNPCGISGLIKFEFIAKTKFLVPVDLIFKMSPEAVKAEFGLSFELASEAEIKQNIEKDGRWARFPWQAWRSRKVFSHWVLCSTSKLALRSLWNPESKSRQEPRLRCLTVPFSRPTYFIHRKISSPAGFPPLIPRKLQSKAERLPWSRSL